MDINTLEATGASPVQLEQSRVAGPGGESRQRVYTFCAIIIPLTASLTPARLGEAWVPQLKHATAKPAPSWHQLASLSLDVFACELMEDS